MDEAIEDLLPIGGQILVLASLVFWLLVLFDAAQKARFGWFVLTLFVPLAGPFYLLEVRHDRKREAHRRRARALRDQAAERRAQHDRQQIAELRREVAELRRGPGPAASEAPPG